MVVYGSEPVVIIRIYVAYSGKGYFHVLNKNCLPVNLCGLIIFCIYLQFAENAFDMKHKQYSFYTTTQFLIANNT